MVKNIKDADGQKEYDLLHLVTKATLNTICGKHFEPLNVLSIQLILNYIKKLRWVLRLNGRPRFIISTEKLYMTWVKYCSTGMFYCTS